MITLIISRLCAYKILMYNTIGNLLMYFLPIKPCHFVSCFILRTNNLLFIQVVNVQPTL